MVSPAAGGKRLGSHCEWYWKPWSVLADPTRRGPLVLHVGWEGAYTSSKMGTKCVVTLVRDGNSYIA